MTGDTSPLLLPVVDWPDEDRVAWKSLFAEGDILDGQGPCIGWSEGSRRKREQSYSRWLGYLQSNNGLFHVAHPGQRATPETIAAFIDCEQQRCKMSTVHLRVEDLWFLFRAMDPETGWQWLYQIVHRLRAVADIGYLKPHPGIDASQIFEWALARICAVEAETGCVDLDRAVRYRDGLMAGLLISAPVRARAFVAITIEQHMRDMKSGYLLSFKPADMKDRKHHDFPVHSQLTAPMKRYLETYRPVLLQGATTDRLWVSRRGNPLCTDSLYGHLCDLTRREFGEKLGPHAFRHVAATTIAMMDPEHVGIIADVLGHSSLNMADEHYNHASSVGAVARYQDLRSQLKREARRREARRRRSKVS